MTIIRILFLFILLGSGILFLVRKLSFSQYLAPFITITGITSLLYVFALVNLLKQGLIVIIVALLLMGLFSFLKWPIKKTSEKIKISPPLVAWAAAFLIIAVTTVGTLFYKWDEFSYWGVIYRYVMATNHLPDLASNFLVKNYPPFTVLFQYFIGNIVKNAESSTYFAQILIAFSAIIAILPIVKWNNWLKYAAAFALCILSVFPLDLRFQSLYVDIILGLLFAAGLASAVFNENTSSERVVTITLASIALSLTKPLGVIFALACIVILFFDVLVRNYQVSSIKTLFVSTLKTLLKPKIILLIFLTFLANLSWSVHTKQFNNSKINLSINANPVTSNDIYPGNIDYYLSDLNIQAEIYGKNTYLLNQPNEINISLADIFRIFTANVPYSTKLIIQNFINNVSVNPFSTINVTNLQVLIFILIISASIFLIIPKVNRKESALPRNTAILFIGFLVYCFSLLFAYIYYFPPAAGIETPSLHRYLSSYFIGWWLLIICILDQQETVEVPTLNFQASKVMMAVLLFGIALITPLSSYIHSPNTPDSRRFDVHRIYKAINGKVDSQDKVFDIWQVDSFYGLSHYIMKFYLTPSASNNYAWRISADVSTEDRIDDAQNGNTTELQPDEWLALLNDQHYTYVLVCSSDYYFWQEYGSLFDTYEDKNVPQLFSVSPTGLINVPIDVKY